MTALAYDLLQLPSAPDAEPGVLPVLDSIDTEFIDDIASDENPRRINEDTTAALGAVAVEYDGWLFAQALSNLRGMEATEGIIGETLLGIVALHTMLRRKAQ